MKMKFDAVNDELVNYSCIDEFFRRRFFYLLFVVLKYDYIVFMNKNYCI